MAHRNIFFFRFTYSYNYEKNEENERRKKKTPRETDFYTYIHINLLTFFDNKMPTSLEEIVSDQLSSVAPCKQKNVITRW